MRNRAFSLLLVVACGGGGGETGGATTPQPSASTPVTTTTAPTPSASASASTDSGDPCKALTAARAPEYDKLKQISDSKDPMARMASLGDEVVASFRECHKTKSGGAWGIGLKDLKEEKNGVSAQLVAWHVDKAGGKTSLVLPSTSTILGERMFQSHDKDKVIFDKQQLFDFDGDGEEEFLLGGHDQTQDGIKDPLSYVVMYKTAGVGIYPPAKDVLFFRVEDIDRDGRPDLVTYGPYRSHIGARCNGAPAVAFGPAIMAHSLPDGAFSMVDPAAMKFAKIGCEKPGFAVARDDEKNVDDEATFVSAACARLWGMSEAQLLGSIGQSCGATPQGACSEASRKGCVYGAALGVWAKAKPPVTIK